MIVQGNDPNSSQSKIKLGKCSIKELNLILILAISSRYVLRARHTGYEMTVDKLIGPDIGSKRSMDRVSCSVAPSVLALE